jgi:hypothetical protein
LPVNPAQITKLVAASSVSISLEVTPAQPWTVRDRLHFKVTVRLDTAAGAGRSVEVRIEKIYDTEPSQWKKILSGTTDSNGVFEGDWTIPFYDVGDYPPGTMIIFPCTYWYFNAIDVATGVGLAKASKPWGNIAYPSRISIEAPNIVIVGQPYTISGVLERESDENYWTPLANRTVKVYRNGSLLATPTTDSNGRYSVTDTITSPGTYTLKAVYDGEGFRTAAAAATLGLQVLVSGAAGLVGVLAPLAAGFGMTLLARRR